MVGELADNTDFVVVDGDDRWYLCIMSHDVCLLQTDRHPEVLMLARSGPFKYNDPCWVWVATTASSNS